MRAAVYYGKEDVRIEQVPDPGPPGPGEVLVWPLAASICGTDISEVFTGPHLIPLAAPHPHSGHVGPVILGHEFSGCVLATGEGVSGLVPGQRVVPGASMWCGECPRCREGQTNLCERYFIYGIHKHGGMAERVIVPAKMCLPVPPGCSTVIAAIAQPYAIAVHVVRRCAVTPGQTIALYGCGGIGSLILDRLARQTQGQVEIIAFDVNDERLEKARQLGAGTCINTRKMELASHILPPTHGRRVDVVIEASGAPGTPQAALSMVRPGGQILLVGLQSRPCELDLHTLTRHEISLRSSNGFNGDDLQEALLHLAEHPDLEDMVIDRVIPLRDLFEQGLCALASGKIRGKVIIDMLL